MKATRANLRFFAACLVAFAYDTWNTATNPAPNVSFETEDQ